MKKSVTILLCLSILLIALFASMSQKQATITGMHHTPLVTGRIIRGQSLNVPCNDAGAKTIGSWIKDVYGCRERKNWCAYAVAGDFPRQNKVTVEECGAYDAWKRFIDLCNKQYIESCTFGVRTRK